MAAFGDDLRAEREQRGVSLDGLSVLTKISTRHLESLEREQFHQLPGGIFRRGILRAYLNALGLSESEWLPRFESSVAESAGKLGLKLDPQEDAWVTFASNVKKNRISQQRTTAGRWMGVVVLALVLAVAAWALWHFELQRLHA